MSEQREVTCDGCGRDITSTSNSVDYRLRLTAEGKTPQYLLDGQMTGVMTDMMIYPPIMADKHFCGLACLDKWREPPRVSGE